MKDQNSTPTDKNMIAAMRPWQLRIREALDLVGNEAGGSYIILGAGLCTL